MLCSELISVHSKSFPFKRLKEATFHASTDPQIWKFLPRYAASKKSLFRSRFTKLLLVPLHKILHSYMCHATDCTNIHNKQLWLIGSSSQSSKNMKTKTGKFSFFFYVTHDSHEPLRYGRIQLLGLVLSNNQLEMFTAVCFRWLQNKLLGTFSCFSRGANSRERYTMSFPRWKWLVGWVEKVTRIVVCHPVRELSGLFMLTDAILSFENRNCLIIPRC